MVSLRLLNVSVFFLLFVGLSKTLPIDIFNCTNLQAISSNLTTSYQLANDIDCNGFAFKEIGNASFPFSGMLDGKNFSIKNINITSNQSGVGIFGYADSASIFNLILEGVSIFANSNSNSDVGCLIGFLSNSNIFNIHIYPDGMSNKANYVGCVYNCGGGFGRVNNSVLTNITIKNTFVDAYIPGSATCAGGIVGELINSSISNCHNLGSNNSSSILVSGFYSKK